jgi:hypothetical protein
LSKIKASLIKNGCSLGSIYNGFDTLEIDGHYAVIKHVIANRVDDSFLREVLRNSGVNLSDYIPGVLFAYAEDFVPRDCGYRQLRAAYYWGQGLQGYVYLITSDKPLPPHPRAEVSFNLNDNTAAISLLRLMSGIVKAS